MPRRRVGPLAVIHPGHSPSISSVDRRTTSRCCSSHTAQDPGTDRDAAALAGAARLPLSVTRLSLHRGGHNFDVWRAEEPVAFAWISSHLVAPLAPPPVIDKTAPVVVTSQR